jgi:integrase
MPATNQRPKSSATQQKSKPKSPRRYETLTEDSVRHRHDFASEFEVPPVLWDLEVRGLFVRVGKHRTSFVFRKEHSFRGKRATTFKRLGFWPAMSVREARKEALKQAGRIASGKLTPGKRAALKVDEAMTAYIAYLKSKSLAKGKAATWSRHVESTAKNHIIPTFGSWTLLELSDSPATVVEWHREVTKKSGDVAANHAARILRAAYRRAAKLDRSLPSSMPTNAIEFNRESRSQNALDFTDFPQWLKAWEKIESPTRRAFQMVNLLSGARPGELARLRWSDIEHRSFIIRGAKAENDIHVPISAAIAWAFKLARAHRIEGNDYVFPARAGGHIAKFDVDQLPAWGMSLRRTWRTIAADCGVDELLAHFLMGHIPAGVSRGYVAKMMLTSGQGMRSAQRRVSLRMVQLLKGR